MVHRHGPVEMFRDSAVWPVCVLLCQGTQSRTPLGSRTECAVFENAVCHRDACGSGDECLLLTLVTQHYNHRMQF